ncbi:hypothetical protein ACFWIA_35065 [Streptomyces sp. NPDC127068]|uniref:hypothetical protein n=1 Tax=Streptomyces sp. NPDC127068 TaxID=3347127 RepID=UPI0036698702
MGKLALTTRSHVPDSEALLRAVPDCTTSDTGATLVLATGAAGEDDSDVLTTWPAAKPTV